MEMKRQYSIHKTDSIQHLYSFVYFWITPISGYKTCGIYPFDTKAVLDHDPCE